MIRSLLLLPILILGQETTSVYFNEDPVLVSRVRKFLDQERDGLHREALEIYQEIAAYVSSQASPRPFLYEAEEGLYLPVEEFLRGRVRSFPRDVLEAVRREADLQARPQWEEILRRAEVGRLREFLRRNPLSSYVPRAAEALAGFHLERGEFEDALGTLSLLRGPDDITGTGRLIRDACRVALGREIPDGETPPEILDGIEGTPARAGGGIFGGDGTHARVPPVSFDPGRRIARVPISEVPVRPRWSMDPLRGSRRRPAIPYFPVFDGERLILSDTFAVSAHDPASGSLLWRRSVRTESSVSWGSTTPGEYPGVTDGVVLVTLSPREAAQLHLEGEGDAAVREIVPGSGYRVVALQASSGKTLWETTGLEADFVSSPLPVGGRVYVLLTRLQKEASASVACLDGRTGEEIWETQVCSTFSSMILGRGFQGAYLAAGGGRIFVSTNLGAVASLDAVSGGMVWARAYTRYPPATYREMLSLGAEHPDDVPILSAGRFIAAPRDTPDLLAIDAISGRLLWAHPRAEEERLLAVVGEVVLLGGDGLLGIHRETGRVLWRRESLPSEMAGRPAIAGELIYTPAVDGLYLHRASDGTEVGRYLWSDPAEEAGNVLFAGGRMTTASWSHLNSYEDRSETLRALALLPETQARTGEGEVFLRRGNVDRAIEALETVRDRDPGAAALLARAYRTRGDEARLRGDHGAAAEAYDMALPITPPGDRIALLLEVAGYHRDRGAPEDALRLYRRVMEETAGGRLPHPSAAVADQRIRIILGKEGREIYHPYEEEARRLLDTASRVGALEGYLKITREYPNSLASLEAHGAIAAIYEGQSLWNLAASHLEAVIRDAPDSNPETYLRLADVQERAGLTQRARKVLRILQGRGETSQALSDAMMRLEMRAGDPPDFSPSAGLIWQVAAEPALMFRRIIRPDPHAPPSLDPGFVVIQDEVVEVRDLETGLIRWRGLTDSLDRRPGPVVRGDRLYLARQGTIIGVDTRVGEIIWTWSGNPGGQILPRLAADDRYVVVTSLPDEVVLLDANSGAEVRRLAVAGLNPVKPPVVSQGKVILSLSPAGLAVIDPDCEDPPLRHQERTFGSMVSSGPVLDDEGRVFLLINSKKIICLDTLDLSVIWSAEYPLAETIEVPPGGGPLIVLPRRSPGGVSVLRALQPVDGKEIWATPLEEGYEIRATALSAEVLYLAEREGFNSRVTAYTVSRGQSLWTWRSLGRSPTRLVVTRGHVIAYLPAAAPPSRIIILNRLDGQAVDPGGIPVPVERLASDMALVDEILIVTGGGGTFGYGRRITADLRRRLASLEEAGDDPERLAAVRFALGRRREAVEGLSRTLLREDLGVSDERFRRLFEQMEGYRRALAEAGPVIHEVPRVYRPPDIDGDLGDWYSEMDEVGMREPMNIAGMPGSGDGPVPWRGREDLSGVLYMGWDNEHFYFAIDVQDNYLRPYDNDAGVWKGDCLLIALDCQNDGGYWITADDQFVTLALHDPGKQGEDGEEDEDEEKTKPKGDYFVRRKDDNSGVIYEAAIPWEFFVDSGREMDAEKGPEAGFTFGFNPIITDDDGGEGRARKTLSWTQGIRLHSDRERLMMDPGEIVPKYFGKIRLR